MEVIKPALDYFDRHNLKTIETLWLAYVHVLGIVGAIWFLTLESQLFYRYLLVLPSYISRRSTSGTSSPVSA